MNPRKAFREAAAITGTSLLEMGNRLGYTGEAMARGEASWTAVLDDVQEVRPSFTLADLYALGQP